MRLLLALLIALPVAAQTPAGQPKTRLELADSARQAPAPVRATAAPVVRADTGVSGVAHILRSSFVRNQALLGVTLYGPSFAATVTDAAVPAAAAYLVMAGGTFFAAAELSRDIRITDGMELLATRMPIRGAGIGAALQYALTGKEDYAAGIFFGSVLGTTGALTLGQRLTTGAAMGAIFGADAAAAIAMSTMYALNTDSGHARARAAVGAGAAVAGMQLGAMYASYARYNVTAGDVQTLWTSSLIGAVAAGTAVANGNPDARTVTFTLLGGGVAGLLAGDRLLVRRYDHSRSDGSLVGVGAIAGALMGGGVAVLVGSSDRFNAATAALGAAGAAGGVFMAERWLGARPDAGRRLGQRLNFAPQALAMAVAKMPGTYSILSYSF
jgi:hypothetical protein